VILLIFRYKLVHKSLVFCIIEVEKIRLEEIELKREEEEEHRSLGTD